MSKVLKTESQRASQLHVVRFLPLLTLLLCSFVTYFLWFSEQRESDRKLQTEFKLQVANVQQRVEQRFDNYRTLLRGVSGTITLKPEISRTEFNMLVQDRRLSVRAMGLQGVGFAQIVPGDALAQHVSMMRKQGVPDYRLWPEGRRDMYTSIDYLEPLDARNHRALGYDMYSESVRRTAMQLARDNNEVTLSGKVHLVQENGRDVQAGFLIYAPVYRANRPHDTLLERRENLIGWAYSPVRVKNFVETTFGESWSSISNKLDLQIYDGDVTKPEAMMFDLSRPSSFRSNRPESFQTLHLLGHTWTLRARARDAFEAQVLGDRVDLIALAGALGTLLLSCIVWLLVRLNIQSIDLITDKTRDLLRSQERLSLATKGAGIGVWDYNPESGELFWDDSLFALYHLDRARFKGVYDEWKACLHPDDLKAFDERVQRSIREKTPLDTVFRIIWSDGEVRNIHCKADVVSGEDGTIHRMVGINIDVTERVHAEKLIHESEQRFRAYFERSMVGMATTSVDKGWIDVNDALCNMLGYKREELIGKTWAEMTHPDDLAENLAKHASLLSGEIDEYSMSKRFIRSDGGIVNTYLAVRSVRRVDHSVDYVVALIEDITARVKAEDQILREREKYRNLLLNSMDGIHVLDADGNILEANEAFGRMLGYTRDELLHMNLAQIDMQWDATGLKAKIAYAMMHGIRLETRQRHRDGHLIEVEINSNGVDLGGERVLFASARDITERKHTQQQLHESEENLRTIFDYAAIGIARLSLQGQFLQINDTCCKMIGYSEQEILSGTISFQQITHPEDLAADIELIRQLLTGEIETYHIEKRYFHKSGAIVWVFLAVSLMRDEAGNPRYLISAIQDITQRKRAEFEVLQAKEELEDRVESRTAELKAANEELEGFSYSVSHDLRTPLRAIDGFSQMLLEDYASKLNAEGLRYLSVIRNNTTRMGQLIDDILHFSRAGRTQLSVALVNMGNLVGQVIADLGLSMDVRRVVFQVDPLHDAQVDVAMMRQVWENLLSNAIKFSANVDEPCVQVGSRIEGDEVVYFIRDNGAGFDMRYAAKLFGVFQRLHGVEEFKGTGIGLAIAKRVITRHGGRIWAEGVVGGGATFYFSLPNKEVKQ